MRASGFNADNQKSFSTLIFVVVLLLTFLFYTNFQSTESVVLDLEITENKEIIFDGIHTSMLDFPVVIDQSIAELEDKGVNRDRIIVALHPARSLNLGVITDVQRELRENNLRKITYER